MSIIATQIKVATLSAATKKAFNAVPLNDILHGAIYREGVTDTTTIKPSDIRMNQAAALTALGGKMSPQSFVLGLVFAAVRYAHGQQIDGTSLPSGSLTAINASLSMIKKGAGINALSLETATKAGIDALLALPAPVTVKKTAPAALNAPVAIAEPNTLNRLALRAGIARRSESAVNDCSEEGDFNPHHVAAAATATAATAAAYAAYAERLRKNEEATAQYLADAESSAAALVASVTSRRDAQEIASEIAKSLGFRLVKIATKKAA